MFKKLLVIAVLCLLAANVSAVDALTGLKGRVIMQSGEKAIFAYEGGFDIPTVTNKSKSYRITTEITYIYSDRGFEDEVKEIEALRTMAVGSKSFLNIPVFVNLGAGFWQFMNSGGENQQYGAYTVGVSYEVAGMKFGLSCDAVTLEGPDIYSPALGVTITAF